MLTNRSKHRTILFYWWISSTYKSIQYWSQRPRNLSQKALNFSRYAISMFSVESDLYLCEFLRFWVWILESFKSVIKWHRQVETTSSQQNHAKSKHLPKSTASRSSSNPGQGTTWCMTNVSFEVILMRKWLSLLAHSRRWSVSKIWSRSEI
jgi:hypothetical protein